MSNSCPGIYQIKNGIDGKLYIGSAVNVDRRFGEHRKQLRGGRHINQKLQRAWDKYGEDVFEFSVVQFCQKDQLIQFEQFYIDKYACVKKGYNIHPNARNSTGRKVKSSTKAKISEALRGRTLSPEHRQAISRGGKGVKRGLSTRLKMSQSFSGVPKTPEHRAKLAAALRGRTLPAERIENAAKGLRKKYLCESPEGDIFLVVNIKLFCQSNSIIPQLMCKNARLYKEGARKTHKGWKSRELSANESSLISSCLDWLHSHGWHPLPKFPDGIWDTCLDESFVPKQTGRTLPTSAPDSFVTSMG